MNKLIVAKALRTSFNSKKSELLKASYMSDEYCIKMVREMQEEHKEFETLVDDIKKNDRASYDKLLGL